MVKGLFTVSLCPDVVARAKRDAERNNLSFSKHIELLLTEFSNRQDLLDKGVVTNE